MASTSGPIHVISKRDHAQHASFEHHAAPPRLAASSLRIRPQLLALSLNNLSYAQGGTFLHWWATYPVPTTAPAPHHNRDEWGIVPA
jgi:Protein of unknown function (DUF2855)